MESTSSIPARNKGGNVSPTIKENNLEESDKECNTDNEQYLDDEEDSEEEDLQSMHSFYSGKS